MYSNRCFSSLERTIEKKNVKAGDAQMEEAGKAHTQQQMLGRAAPAPHPVQEGGGPHLRGLWRGWWAGTGPRATGRQRLWAGRAACPQGDSTEEHPSASKAWLGGPALAQRDSSCRSPWPGWLERPWLCQPGSGCGW